MAQPNAPSQKGNKLTMNINRITIIGFTGKDARHSSTQNGKSVTKLSVATTKRYRDAEGKWQEKTQWHTCVAYGPVAEYAAKIQSRTLVFLGGEVSYREYERTLETETASVKVQWPVTEIVIESISILDRKGRQGREEAA
jgi:single-strand DNA-binding protein